MGQTEQTGQKLFLPEGIEQQPQTPLEALVAARAVLEVEGRWMRGAWFDNPHQDIDPEDPFCNSWQVCAEGAVGVVVFGAVQDYQHPELEWLVPSGPLLHTGESEDRFSYHPSVEEYKLYDDTLKLLTSAANFLHGYPDEDGDYLWSTASEYNDDDNNGPQTRTDVLVWFDKAIEIAKAAS